MTTCDAWDTCRGTKSLAVARSDWDNVFLAAMQHEAVHFFFFREGRLAPLLYINSDAISDVVSVCFSPNGTPSWRKQYYYGDSSETRSRVDSVRLGPSRQCGVIPSWTRATRTTRTTETVDKLSSDVERLTSRALD